MKVCRVGRVQHDLVGTRARRVRHQPGEDTRRPHPGADFFQHQSCPYVVLKKAEAATARDKAQNRNTGAIAELRGALEGILAFARKSARHYGGRTAQRQIWPVDPAQICNCDFDSVELGDLRVPIWDD